MLQCGHHSCLERCQRKVNLNQTNPNLTLSNDSVINFRSNEMKVYHVSTGQTNPLLWSQVESDFKKLYITNPFNDVFWYPGGSFKSNRYNPNL